MSDQSIPAGQAPACVNPSAPLADGAEVGLARIMLRVPQRGASAHVSGFFEADRLLLAWKSEARQALVCEFALRFTDGAVARGTLILWREARARPALRTHIAHFLRTAAAAGRHGTLRAGEPVLTVAHAQACD